MNAARWVWLWVALALVASATSEALGATPSGTVIANTATANYADGNGASYGTTSNTVVATVAAVSATTVGPNENGCNAQTDAYPVGANVVKTFVVSNVSNTNDAYALSETTSGGAAIVSVTITANGSSTTVPTGGTTPQLSPGQTAQVQITLSTANVAIGSSFETTLSATSTAAHTANAPASATASQCAVAVGRAAIAGPSGPASRIQKLVDGKAFEAVVPGSTVTYTIGFQNYGGVPATNAVLTDTLPQGVTLVAGSVSLNGVALSSGVTTSGQTVTVAMGTIPPATPETLTFSALVSSGASLGTSLVNTATITSDNGSGAASSSAATVFAGIANVVYDGYAGASTPILGARVSLVDANNSPIVFSGAPVAPNTANANPYATLANGTYSFGLGPNQTGPVTYSLTVAATGYLNRRISIALTPDANGTTYTAVLTALDGLPLAVPGGFALTQHAVTLSGISDVFGNIPMFRVPLVTITKTVDRTVASVGDRLVYTLKFSNVTAPLGPATVTDTLPSGAAYAPGTGRLDGVAVEPQIAGRTLRWTTPTLVAEHTIVYAAVVVPGIAPNSTLTNTVTVSSAPVSQPTLTVSANAEVDTLIIDGAFSDRTILTGRVFGSHARDGYFHRGDVGVPGVRLVLEDGESVTTDANGRYSFPGVRPGMHVLRLDLATLPPGFAAFADRAYDSPRSIRRLIHGVFDGGIMEDVNFAVVIQP